MAEGFSRDRLQPALLDRLIDEDRNNPHEAVEARAINKQRLRQCVLRDLNWLFNANAGLAEQVNGESDFTRHSTINFGIRPMSGVLASKVDLAKMERLLKQAIFDFEPRILPDSLVVRGVVPEDPLGHHNVLQFEISGHLWAQPYALELLLKTDLDLETGLVTLRDGGQAIANTLS